MKVAVCSDLHMEFAPIDLHNEDNADVLLLGGDILLANRLREYDPVMAGTSSQRWHEFFETVTTEFKNVIYVLGNHEHYDFDYALTESHLRLCLKRYPNLHLLEKQSLTLDDVTFVGGTMWTNMNNRSPMTIYHLKQRMNDFRLVKNGESPRFLPEDAADDHDQFMGYLSGVLEGKEDQKFWVATHHAPSFESVPEMYKDDNLMNGGYASSLDEFMMDHPQVKVWSHGHMHNPCNYMVGQTRVVCNPRGYAGHEAVADNFKLKVVEL